MGCSTPSFPVLHHLQESAQTNVMESMMLSKHTILCCLLPSIFFSIRVFSNEAALHIRWPKYWSFKIGFTNVYSVLISFRIVWFDLLGVQGTLKSLLQHYISKTLILQRFAFLMVQLSHLYMTTGKTIGLTIWNSEQSDVSLLFNILSRFVIAFLLRSKLQLNFN